MNPTLNVTPPVNLRPRRGIVGGIMLILIGLLALGAQLVPDGSLAIWIVPALGLAFAVWGLLAAEVGLLIPGGILLGVGAGIVLQRGLPALDPPASGGLFMLAMAGGWAFITLMALLLRKFVWWPLIVAAIMALVGIALMIGGAALTVLEWTGKLWPALLVAVGAYWIYRAYTRQR